MLQTHFVGYLFWIFSRLIGSQEGLSTSSMWVEKYVLQVTHVITYCLLGVRLNRHTNFWEFPLEIMIFRSKIKFRLNINNQIDVDQFFINSLHAWRWWTIVSWKFYFKMCLFIEIYLIVTFNCQIVTYVKITINTFTVCVQLSHPLFNRKLVCQHSKHVYTWFT